MYAGNPRETADQVAALEQAGLDPVWVPEAYGFDSPTLMGYLAAKTETVEIGSAILNIYSRTPSAILQTAAGLDNVIAGPGDPRPGRQRPAGDRGLPRGAVRQAARPHPRDRRPGPPRAAARDAAPRRHLHPAPARGSGHRSRQAAQAADQAGAVRPDLDRVAGPEERAGDGRVRRRLAAVPLPPRAGPRVWGDALDRGLAKRQEGLGPLEVSAGGMVAIGEGPETKALLDFARPFFALYVGGMGARGKNFYNDLACQYGYEKEAKEIQDLYLGGNKRDAEARSPSSGSRRATSSAPRRTCRSGSRRTPRPASPTSRCARLRRPAGDGAAAQGMGG